MKVYPYSSPIILTDDLFTAYGGLTGTSTPFQRTAAYLIAEQQVCTYIDTLLLPTDITGSFNYDAVRYSGRVITDYGYVNTVYGARVLDATGEVVYDISGSNSYVKIMDDTYGYLYINDTVSRCVDNGTLQFMYNAGLQSGTSFSPAMLMAMTIAAQITLNELEQISANEGVGDVGIESFSHLQYKEVRKPWKNTAFGASPRARKAAQLIDSTIKKARRALVLGRY